MSLNKRFGLILPKICKDNWIQFELQKTGWICSSLKVHWLWDMLVDMCHTPCVIWGHEGIGLEQLMMLITGIFKFSKKTCKLWPFFLSVIAEIIFKKMFSLKIPHFEIFCISSCFQFSLHILGKGSIKKKIREISLSLEAPPPKIREKLFFYIWFMGSERCFNAKNFREIKSQP